MHPSLMSVISSLSNVLQLDSEQRKELRKMCGSLKQARHSLNDTCVVFREVERRVNTAVAGSYRSAAEEATKDILTPEQMKRLREFANAPSNFLQLSALCSDHIFGDFNRAYEESLMEGESTTTAWKRVKRRPRGVKVNGATEKAFDPWKKAAAPGPGVGVSGALDKALNGHSRGGAGSGGFARTEDGFAVPQSYASPAAHGAAAKASQPSAPSATAPSPPMSPSFSNSAFQSRPSGNGAAPVPPASQPLPPQSPSLPTAAPPSAAPSASYPFAAPQAPSFAASALPTLPPQAAATSAPFPSPAVPPPGAAPQPQQQQQQLPFDPKSVLDMLLPYLQQQGLMVVPSNAAAQPPQPPQ